MGALKKVNFSGSPSIGGTAMDRMREEIFTAIDPTILKAVRDSSMTGEFFMLEKLWRTMKGEWPRLRKNVDEITGNVSRLPFEVKAYQEKGKPATPEAQEHARIVEAALWADSPKAETREMGFSDLLRACAEIPLRGHGVAEILWQKTDKLVSPRAYYPVSSNFYKFTDFQSNADKLVLCPHGLWTTDTMDFPPNKFVIGLIKGSFDHPMYNAKFRPLIFWFGVAKFGPSWLMQYCQLFGIPFRVAKADSKEARAAAKEALIDMGASGILILDPKTDVSIIDMAKAASGLPQAEAIKMADEKCDNLILGQTLTSSTEGVGSQALGKVHNGIRVEVISDYADVVVGIGNNQVIPAILELNLGKVPQNRPYLVYTIPQGDEEDRKLDRIERILKMELEVTDEYVYTQAGVPQPAEGDVIFNPRKRAKESDPKTEEAVEQKTDEQQIKASRVADGSISQIRNNIHADAEFLDALTAERIEKSKAGIYAPVRAGIERMVQLAETPDLTDAEFEAGIKAIMAEMIESGAVDKDLIREELSSLTTIGSILGWTAHSRGEQTAVIS